MSTLKTVAVVIPVLIISLIYVCVISLSARQHIVINDIKHKQSKQNSMDDAIETKRDKSQEMRPTSRRKLQLLDPAKKGLHSPKQLLFSHLPKAGGNEVKYILGMTVGQRGYDLQRENGSLTPIQKSQFFVIAQVRSPCNYLLSLWAFGSDGKGGFYNSIKDKSVYGRTPPYNNEQDLKRFTRWLQNYKHMYSERLMSKYFRFETWKKEPDLNNADCWVHTEMLISDLVNCLKRYQKQGGKMSWEKFHKVYSNRNPSTHVKCDEYFNDERTQLVMDSNTDMIRLFRYDTCCTENTNATITELAERAKKGS